MDKLRILCLHGFCSNGAVHAHQARHITKALSSDFDFLFPDGPHAVDVSSELSNPTTKAGSGPRAWWFADEPKPDSDDPIIYHGLERSLEYIGDVIQRTGPVHAIWGFSQGAIYAGMLVALLLEKNRDHPLRKFLPESQGSPNAGIFISGFKARCPQSDSVFALGIEVPTLHVMGERDEIVTPERSETLMKVCLNPSLLKHGGGHELPKLDGGRQKIIGFIRDNVGSKHRTPL